MPAAHEDVAVSIGGVSGSDKCSATRMAMPGAAHAPSPDVRYGILLSRWFTIPRFTPGACIGRGAPFDKSPERERRDRVLRQAGGPGKHQPTEVGQRVRRLIPGHDARLAPAGGGPPSRDGQDGCARRVSSIEPAGRGRRGPAACRWYWRRATSCHWRSAAEVLRASAAWTAEAGWSLPACSAETGCSTVGPDC
jgi:hypothetical protein